MSNNLIHVFVDLDGEMHKVGQLWFRFTRGREGASFEYDRSWLDSPERFAFLPLTLLVWAFTLFPFLLCALTFVFILV